MAPPFHLALSMDLKPLLTLNTQFDGETDRFYLPQLKLPSMICTRPQP